MRTIVVLSFVFALTQGCGHAPHAATPIPETTEARAAPAPTKADAPAPIAESRDAMLDWIRTKLPPGGSADRDDKGALVVTHVGGAKETVYTLAQSYVALTSVYLATDLVARIAKVNALSLGNPSVAGKKVVIPDIVKDAFGTPEEERLAWPDDHELRAIYLGGRDTLASWESTLAHLQARDMNAVILDGKAYMGEITYASKVDVAVRDNAIAGAPIADLARTIRFAHQHGVRVIMRVSCFHDPWSSVKAPELSIKGYWGGPYPIGWLDPGNEATQKYILDLISEEISLGADEINLDYVRYPVQNGLGNANFHLKDTGRTRISVITDFVKKAHAITMAHHVPLSVDVFGVTATGERQDIEALGQDLAMLSPNVEVLMPMVYPSHYGKGYMGWAEPGNHPEIIAIGTKGAIARAKTGSAIVRPWLQAFNWRSPEYSPKYLAQETVEAKKGGAFGYAMWNPGGYYGDAWTAIPPVNAAGSGGRMATR